ncbi:MAG: aminodeoxychorismate/anthranilate synthase component II [Bdellovibrionales bacterium]|nr:aminodeoxychorismate/anthranilate synthase component II [Bdellovibrionales bacterium]
MKILLLDNYDSFTYNLAHRLREVTGQEIVVVRNDAITATEVREFSHLVLSPGPGIPSEAGRMMEIVSEVKDSMPILGVCLGHQAIAEVYGAKLINLDTVVHGKEHSITIECPQRLFAGLPKTISVGRYHSWVVDEATLPAELLVTARGPDRSIMAIEHKTLPIFGVQFHPESVMTSEGHTILRNWVTL